MAKFKIFPLLALACLLVSCGNNNPSTPSEEPSEPDITDTDTSPDDPEKPDFGLSLAIKDDEPLKIAQFADIHFGNEGQDWHNDKVSRTYDFMQHVVDTAQPDLIVCSGDNILNTGTVKLQHFIRAMDAYETPWTFIYGNHDSESNASGLSKAELNDVLVNSDSEYLLYENEYYETASNRYGNFSIQLTNEAEDQLLGAIVLFDAGIHDGTGYQAITEGQIDWYESKIDALQAIYAGQEEGDYDVVPTMVFSHIQLQEHATLYTRAVNNDGASFVIEQDLGADAETSILDGGPKVNTGLYDVMVEKQSTKAYFVGHAHTYNYQVKDDEDGIVLGFGPQVGFSKCFEDNDLARNCYVYNLSSDFTFTTTNVEEDCSNIGLYYSGTYEGKMTIDVNTGLYSVKLDFALWNRILFSYRGERIAVNDFSEITGCFINTTNATWSDDLYTSTGENFIYSGSSGNTYVFTIDLANMTLDISIWIDPDAPVAPVTEVDVKTINSDAGGDAVAVWTTAGTYMRNYDPSNTIGGIGDTNWIGNGWRYFILVDGEGRIAYSVANPPNGYGGPMGTGYYCNSYYNDYLSNPCFELLEGYGPWTSDAPEASRKYNIVIPEGWMAITSHGSANGSLVSAFSNGEIKDSSDANLNRRGLYLDTLRVTFDATNNKVVASWVE